MRGAQSDYMPKATPQDTQVERQYNTPPHMGKATLDFGPFAQRLARLSDARRIEVSRIICDADIPQLRRALDSGALAAVELLLHYVSRIKRHDVDQLNAVLALNPDAIDIAAKLDVERAAGARRGPLHGIPVLLKDNIATGDRMATTAGAKALEHVCADRDALLVQRLRDAGAVILGKANLSEWANFMTTTSANGFSLLGGQTRNPYGRFDVSGSSSGSAVAVAADLVTVAVGTETSGSIISPAAQNSIVALKPSLGLISRDYIIPICDAMDTAGPMTRSVTDLAILLTVLAGADPTDRLSANTAALHGTDFSAFLNPDGLLEKRIGLRDADVIYDAEERAILASARSVMEQAGATVLTTRFDPLKTEYIPAFEYGLREGVNGYLQRIGAPAPASSLADIIAFNGEDLPNRAPFGQDRLVSSQNTTMTADAYAALAVKCRRQAAKQIHRVLAARDVSMLVTLNTALTCLYAPAGCPALTVPAGRRRTGEPVNITLVGAYLAESELIAAAYAFEQASNWRNSPRL